VYHFSNLASRSIICQFMMILAGLSAQLNICWVVHVHTVQALSIHHPVRPHHHHHQQGKRAERSDRRERRGGRPAVARRDGRITLGRWNARQLPCRYGHVHHPRTGHSDPLHHRSHGTCMHLYVCYLHCWIMHTYHSFLMQPSSS